MIKSIQKVIKIGTSGGVTIPAKDLKLQNIKFGDKVEVTVRPIKTKDIQDQQVLDAAKRILKTYQKDFVNLAKR